MVNWTWGDPDSKFPETTWDDFDGELELIEYINRVVENVGERTYIRVVILPAEYEYRAREIQYDPDNEESKVEAQYGMGSIKYRISTDGYNIAEGPPPTKQSRAYEFIRALQNSGVDFTDINLKPLNDIDPPLNLHWKGKRETIRGQEGQEARTYIRLFPVGEALGYPRFGGAGEEAGGTTRRRRGRGAAAEASTAEVSAETQEAEAQPARRARRSQTAETAEAAETEAPASPNGEVSEEAKALLLSAVESRGARGLRVSQIPQRLIAVADGADDADIEAAQTDAAINALIRESKIEQEDDMLYLVGAE